MIRTTLLNLKASFKTSSLADVIKSAVFVSPLALIRLICGFFRSKMAAIFIGVAGVGLLGQANQFLLLICSLGSLGMVNSLMQQMSLYRENNDIKSLQLVKGTVLVSQCVFLVLFSLIILIAFRPVTFFFFNSHNSDFSVMILVICLTASLNVLASNYIEGFFTAYRRFDMYVKASSISTILNLIVFIPAVYFWKVQGGLLSIIFGEVSLFLIFLYYVLKLEKFRNIFPFKFDKSIFKLTFRDGTVNLFCSFLALAVGLLMRQMVIKNTGEFKNGIYQFCLSITAYYTPFLTNLLWAKYFPLISAKKITDETRDVIKNTLLFIVVAGCFLTACVLISADMVIKILATQEFDAAKKYLPIQFIGDFWYFIFYTYSIYLLGVRNIKQYLILYAIYLGLQYLLSVCLVNFWGLNGVIGAYAISCIMVGSISMYYFYKIIGSADFKIYSTIFISFIFIVAEATFTIFNITIWLKLILLAFWLYFFAKPLIHNKINKNISTV